MLRMSDPHTAEQLLQDGNACLARNDLQGAVTAYRRALEMDPEYIEAHYNCGVALHRQGRLEPAVAHYARALDLYPAFPEACFNLASACSELNRHEEAQQLYLKVMQIQPDNAAAPYNLGLLHQARAEDDRAMALFEKAVAIDPAYAEALNNIGVIHRDADRLDDAQVYFEKALVIRTGFPEALYNMGVVCQKKGLLDDALGYYERALAADVDYAPARWLSMLALPMYYEDETGIEHHRQRFAQNLTELIRTTPLGTVAERQRALKGLSVTANFYLQYQARNDLALQCQYGRFATDVMAANFPQWSRSRPMPERAPDEKIRIGYLSSCMYGHTIGVFLAGWLRNTDRDEFDWYAYHVGDHTDALTQKIADSVDHYHHFPGDLTGAADRIEKDKLHILVHTDIGMNPITLQLAALRLAAVQCKGWGHPVTTGLPTMDYYLSSDLMEPEQADAHYSEKLIRLPNLALNFTPPALPDTPKPRGHYNIPESATVFLTTQSLFKYLPQHDDVFTAIAEQVPGAVFVFIAHKAAEATRRFSERLARAFAARNLPFDVIFVPPMPHTDFLGLNMNADVLLDSLEWSGGKTSLEALTCDLPVVTLPGRFMRGRHTYAFLTRMGLTETIAADKADYIRIAVRLGMDLEYREKISTFIQSGKHRLFNDETVNAALTDFYKKAIKTAENRVSSGDDMKQSETSPATEQVKGRPHPGKAAVIRTIERLIDEGKQLSTDKSWERAAVCFERALAHIPNYMGVNLWYQRYLLDDAQPPDCSPAFVADLYAKIAGCRFNLGQVEDSKALTTAALRLDQHCASAQRLEVHIDQLRSPPEETRVLPQRATAPGTPLTDAVAADKISILVVSSFTKNVVRYKELAPPTTGLVKATCGSMLQNFGDGLLYCNKMLCYDRPSERFDLDRQYESALSEFAYEFGFHFNTFDFAGLQSVIVRMVEQVDTPYLLFLEHDWLFHAPPIDLATILHMFDKYPEINFIRYNKWPNFISNLDFLLSAEQRYQGAPLLRTTANANSPHVVRTSVLKEKWLPICLDDPICTSRILRGTVCGTKEILFKHHMMDVRKWGFGRAHEKWGTYIAGPFEAPQAVIHLGE